MPDNSPPDWTGFEEVGSASPPDQDWSAFEPVESTPMQKLGAVGLGAQSGMMETLPEVGGLAAGAAIGALGGPFAPITVPLGAAIGLGAGYLFGKQTKKLLGVPKPEELSPDQRPFAIAGEVVGGGLPFSGAAVGAARLGARLPASRVGNWLNKVIDYAAERPGAFIRSETSGLAAAGAAGAAAESYDPGNPLTRAGAEIVGGLLSPSRLLSNAADGAVQSAKSVMQSLTPAGRETRAAQYIQGLIRQSGEDPDVLAAMLRAPDASQAALTSAQKTGSPALAAFEAQLAKESAKFGADAEKTATGAFDIYNGLITGLRGTGDPAALQAAGQLRAQYFRTLLATRAQQAEREAVEAAGKITADKPSARAALSRQADEIVDRAFADARKVESELWGAIPKAQHVYATGTVKRYDEILDELLPEEKLPAVIEGFVTRMTSDPTGVHTTVGEMLRFRSRTLALAREAAGTGKSNEARIYGQMAEAALDDLGGVANPAVQEARTFSRELHDTFTRTFAGEATARRATGADRIPPEVLLGRALSGKPEMADLRLRQLEEATSFLSRKGLNSPEAAQNLGTMLDAQERILRLAAADAVDPQTGLAVPARITKFLRDNTALMDRFPEVATDLENAVKTTQGLRDVGRLISGASRIIERETAFAKLGKFDSPAQAISSALASKTPESEYRALAKLASRGGRKAVAGLRAATWDHALSQATGNAGTISLAKLRSAFLDPPQPGIPNLKDMMLKNGVIDEAGARQLETIFDETTRIEKVLRAGGDLKDVLALPGAMTELVLRITGSRLGATAGQMIPGIGGGSLIAQSAGSKFVRDMFGRIPSHRVQQVFIEAAENPRFMAMLLEKPKTQAQGIRLARNLHAYMIQAGLTNADMDSRNEERITTAAESR